MRKMAKAITLKALRDRFSLSDQQLNRELSDEHLLEVCMIIDEHEALGRHLSLTEGEITKINPKLEIYLQRMRMLTIWKQKCSWKATYRKLIEALLKYNKGDQARCVCELLCQPGEPENESEEGLPGNHDHDGVGPMFKRGRLYSTDRSIVDPTVPYKDAKRANTRLEYLSKLNICDEPQELSCVRNTGIICTVGPACSNVQVLKKLIKEGLCVARLNLSHFYTYEHCRECEYEAEQRVVEMIQNLKKAGRTIAIALDTKGREIRTGLLKGDSVLKCHHSQDEAEEDRPSRRSSQSKPEGCNTVKVEIEAGSKLQLSTDERYKYCGDQNTIYVDHKDIIQIVSVGDLVFIDEGRISLKVTEAHRTHLSTEVLKGGTIIKRRGVNLPRKKVELPVLTEQDERFLKLGVKQDVDMVFASFVQDEGDVQAIRNTLGEEGSRILVISKIENEEGLRNFDEILRKSDGIMVARGDLGIEIPQQKVFIAQKMMISCCNRAGKPVIVATQMLENMIDKPDPTRAELSDIANAVLDGADCVTLSEETAIGHYPVEALSVMSKVALEAEAAMFHRSVFQEMCKLTSTEPTSIVEATAIAAVNASFQLRAAAIVTVTISGKTAFVLSQYRPHCPIIAVTGDNRTARICHLRRNVFPLLCNEDLSKDEWLEKMEEKLMAGVDEGIKKGFIKEHSIVVLLSGWRPGPNHINTMRIIKVEEDMM